MPNYPFVSPQDETSQYLASILQQYKPGSLGNTATIGNPQGQQDYAAQLAQALAEMETSTKQQERASAMQNPEFIQNSGALGVLAVMAQAYAGKKMDEKASKKYEDASMRAMTAKDVLDEAKAERAAAKALKATQEERKQRGTDADQFGLTPDERKRYVLTGSLPTEVRDRVQAVQGQDGFVAANLDRGTWSRLREEGSQSQQLPPNVNVRYQPDDGVDPEQDRKIFDALVAQDMQRPAPTSMDEHVDAGMVRPQQQGGALMPYKDPAIAQRQALADNRAEESLGLQRRADQRAEEDAARKRNAPKPVTEDQSKSAGYALRMERALGSIAKSSKENPGANRPGVGTALLDILPDAVGNQIKSPERQNIEAAQLDALDAALTLNTGAAYTKEQLFGLRKSYFPQPGDAEQTVADKEERLKGLIETARIRARSAYPDGGGSAAAPQGQSSGPRPGDVESGYRFKGGNPADKSNWEPIR